MTAVRQVDQRFARQDPVAEARRVGEGLLVLEGLSGPKYLVVPLPIHASFLSGNKVEVALTDQLAARPAEHCAEGVVEKQDPRSEEHTSELQSLMRISYAVFFLKKKL